MTYKIFDTLQEYNDYTLNGTHLTAGTLYLVKENKSLYFLTNNIDGEAEKYEYLDEIPEGYIKPEGNIIITENGEEIDISTYATASVDVPIPEGYIIPTGNKEITQNGENIDVNDYATATVAVPQPTGNISITENGENIDVAQYATATVNVDAPAKDYIVESVEYDPTATYSGAFDAKKQILNVNIPSGFTSIGDSAFRNCSSLTNVTIPDSVTSIGESAFHSCSRLTSVTIPDGVTSIGGSAFYSCSRLTSVTIPDGVTSIGESAFHSCSRLTSVTIPDSVTSIGVNAFNNCTSLTSINIPDGITEIWVGAFYGCSKLKILDLPSTITRLTNISGNTNYLNLIIRALTPPQLSNNDSFYFVFVDESVIDTYKSDSQWGKFQILSLPIVNDGSELILQVSVSSTSYNKLEHIISTKAYKNINKLTIDGIEQETIDKNKVMTGEHTLKICFTDSRCLYEFTNTIGSPASIKSITIPDGVESIGNSAFNYCSGLTSINIPDSVTSIGGNAFNYCSGLTSINIPDSVTSIGGNAFSSCSRLTSVTIPDGVTSIGGSAFYGCNSLTSVTIQATTPPTLSGSAFNNTNDCPIYVPAESVEAYKTATNWSSYASRIQAIS